MSIDIGIVVVSEAAPSGNVSSDPSMDDWVWLKPSTGAWHKYNGGSWEEVAVPAHEHEGVSGRFSDITRLDIVNGIVVGVEVA